MKCRPPYNRDPEADEKAACLPLLRAQVSLVKPKIIVCLGRISGQVVMWPDFRITREHGLWEERKGYWLSATYHPAALLRDPAKKRESWEDLKKLKEKIEELGIFSEADEDVFVSETVEKKETAVPAADSAEYGNIAEFTEEKHLTENQRDRGQEAVVEEPWVDEADLPWPEEAVDDIVFEDEFQTLSDDEDVQENDVDFGVGAGLSASVEQSEQDNAVSEEDDLDLLGF